MNAKPKSRILSKIISLIFGGGQRSGFVHPARAADAQANKAMEAEIARLAAPVPPREAGSIEQARMMGEHGERLAVELAGRCRFGDASKQDAQGCIQEVRLLLSGAYGSTATSAFLKSLENRMTRADRHRFTTQKDGRLFAVEMLERIAETNGSDEHTAYPYASSYDPDEEAKGEVIPFRTGPQWDQVYKDLRTVAQDMTDEALRGFATILTDALCAQPDYPTGEYRQFEKEGKLLDFGTPGTAYPLPRILTVKEVKARKADSEKAMRAYEKRQERFVAARALLLKLRAQDTDYGCAIDGSQNDLLKAGLLRAGKVPQIRKDVSYVLNGRKMKAEKVKNKTGTQITVFVNYGPKDNMELKLSAIIGDEIQRRLAK